MKQLIQTVDTDGSGFIDFKEFCRMMLIKHKARAIQATLSAIQEPIDDLHVLFRTFCVDQGMSIALRQWSATEFEKVMRCLGQPYTDEKLLCMLESFAPDLDGAVSFVQFANAMTAANPSEAQLEACRPQFAHGAE